VWKPNESNDSKNQLQAVLRRQQAGSVEAVLGIGVDKMFQKMATAATFNKLLDHTSTKGTFRCVNSEYVL